jgi:outer membrane lipoprotein carrier protein
MRPLRAYARAAFLAVTCLCVGAYAADAGSGPLDRFLDGLTSLHTAFTQTVTDAKGKQVESGAGTLLVQRPGKFRWDYTPHDSDAVASPPKGDNLRGQLLVADGKNLWFYDRELAQVTVKPVNAALSTTPVMLLSGSAAQLRDAFDISAGGNHDGMDWVHVRPKSDEADFSAADLGFAREQLMRMVIHDRLGQTVQLDFSHGERNARVDASELQFKAPAGVDVIGTPQS